MPPRMRANYMTHTDDMRIMLAGFRIASQIAATDVPDLAWWIFTNQSSKNHVTTVRCGKATRLTRNGHWPARQLNDVAMAPGPVAGTLFQPLSKYPVVQM